ARHRRSAAVEVVPARRDPVHGDRPRILSAAGLDHLDDRADRPAAVEDRRLRLDLVRRADDDRHGDGSHPSAGRSQYFRHQEHCPGYPAARRRVGGHAIRRADVRRDLLDLHLSGNRHGIPELGDGLAMNARAAPPRIWNKRAQRRASRLERAATRLGTRLAGKLVEADAIVALLEEAIEAGDRVCIEGNNQKQADFLARALIEVDRARVHDLHIVQSVLALPEHLDVFERGIASRLDFSFSGPQAARLAKLAGNGQIAIGAIHTYLELFGRYFIDLTPDVALVAAQAADREGNLYTGPNTEDTPVIAEATAFKSGVVIAQVNEQVEALPRIDIPSDWVDFVVASPSPHYIEPLFTRDPAMISEIQVLMAMMAIKGIYAHYGVDRLNHGIGFDTAAIELLLPTYAESLGLRGMICRYWALYPHPTLIPDIDEGF